jgi:hypothetical protein
MTRQESLNRALDLYWNAKSAEEMQFAYYAILLLGGADGYPPAKWRAFAARCLRLAALWIEGEWRFSKPERKASDRLLADPYDWYLKTHGGVER